MAQCIMINCGTKIDEKMGQVKSKWDIFGDILLKCYYFKILMKYSRLVSFIIISFSSIIKKKSY